MVTSCNTGNSESTLRKKKSFPMRMKWWSSQTGTQRCGDVSVFGDFQDVAVQVLEQHNVVLELALL